MRIHVGIFLENHAGDFQLDDLRFVVAERRENFVAVRAKLRCRLRWQRRAIELDRHADHVEAENAVVDDALHADRKIVVQGKSVAVRVELGGSSIIKNTNKTTIKKA